MKQTCLILSFLFLTGCPWQSELPKNVYISNFVKGVCSHYEITDPVNLHLRFVDDLPLDANGPCKYLIGQTNDDWLKTKNFIKDQIEECEK